MGPPLWDKRDLSQIPEGLRLFARIEGLDRIWARLRERADRLAELRRPDAGR